MRYQWYIQPNDGELTEVFPIYKDDLAINYERESGQMFFREKLSGKLTFVGDDFTFLTSNAFDAAFHVTAKRNGADYYQGVFYFTDCEINYDDNIISVQPEIEDAYDNILNNYEKELDLLQQAVETENITYYKRPMIQVYIKGEDVANCLIGNSCWEQDVTEATTDTGYLVNTCHFALNTLYKQIMYVGSDGVVQAWGIYAGRAINNGTDALAENNFNAANIPCVSGLNGTTPNTAYQITCRQSQERKYDSQQQAFYWENTNLIQLVRISDSVVVDEYKAVTTNLVRTFDAFESGSFTGNGGGVFMLTSQAFYARYVCDVATIDTTPTYEISDNDLVENNRNYKRCIGYINEFIGAVSYLFSDEPTQYGRYENKYYLPPTSLIGTKYYPIAQSTWSSWSYWVKYPTFEHTFEYKARAEITLKDAIPLHAVISALLAKYAPEITFSNTTDYSVFLYDQLALDLYITQKTNILVAQYTQAAQKGTITLRDVFDMLKKCFNAYWFIENGKLRIEHVRFFENGGSYSLTPIDYIDLTEAENVRNGKKWTFGQNAVTFDKEDMPAQFTYTWMDDVSDVFAGQPIEIQSAFVKEDKIEEINIANFVTDVDKMLLLPSDFSQDGWALLGATNNQLPIVTLTIGYDEYYLQNGWLSMTFLQPNYLRYDLPAPLVKINGQDTQALSVSRKKKQQVAFPMPTPKPNTNQTIKTAVGSGEIDALSVTILSDFAKGTIKFPTT